MKRAPGVPPTMPPIAASCPDARADRQPATAPYHRQQDLADHEHRHEAHDVHRRHDQLPVEARENLTARPSDSNTTSTHMPAQAPLHEPSLRAECTMTNDSPVPELSA